MRRGEKIRLGVRLEGVRSCADKCHITSAKHENEDVGKRVNIYMIFFRKMNNDHFDFKCRQLHGQIPIIISQKFP